MVGGGDQVDDLNCLAAGLGDGAPELSDLRRAGKGDPIGHGRDLDGAGDALPAPCGGLPGGGHIGPGQVLELVVQGGHVGFHGEHVIPARGGDECGGVGLGVHRIHRHRHPGQLQPGQ